MNIFTEKLEFVDHMSGFGVLTCSAQVKFRWEKSIVSEKFPSFSWIIIVLVSNFNYVLIFIFSCSIEMFIFWGTAVITLHLWSWPGSYCAYWYFVKDKLETDVFLLMKSTGTPWVLIKFKVISQTWTGNQHNERPLS